MTALSVPVCWWAGCTEMPRVSAARRNTSDRNTLPWSITTVSGMMTGLAAASSMRSSMLTSLLCGIREADMARAWSQPGRADGPGADVDRGDELGPAGQPVVHHGHDVQRRAVHLHLLAGPGGDGRGRSEEHTSELQS